MYPLIYFLLPALAKATYVITVYGDVYSNTKFFTKTYPWLIDNVGGDISVDYYLLGSGKYSVPQMCALSQLKSNTYLQADYLKCEAEGTRSEICLCRSGIDPQKFRQCVLERGNKAGLAAFKYSQLNIDAMPIIELGPKNSIFELTSDEWWLKKICTIFGDDKPRGCLKPFSCENATDALETRAISHFDCTNVKEDCQVQHETTTPRAFTEELTIRNPDEYTTIDWRYEYPNEQKAPDDKYIPK